jgi:hypothetical protein
MIHPDSELRYINDTIGYGVFARKLIRKGTITWIPDPLQKILEPEEVDRLPKVFQEVIDKYAYRNKYGQYVIEYDFGRYVNHSSKSNCLTTAYDFELAIRDILPGEELTDDYGSLNIDVPFECLPEPGISRTLIFPDDILRYHEEWDAYLRDAFKQFIHVEQPLLQYLPNDLQETALAVAKNEIPMESILTCYYDQNNEMRPRKPLR